VCGDPPLIGRKQNIVLLVFFVIKSQKYAKTKAHEDLIIVCYIAL